MRSLLKRIFAPERRAQIRANMESFDRKLAPFFAKNAWLSSFYYLFISRQFAREHHSVLKGRVAYWQQLSNPSSASAMLRRNIHRVEKGLIMRPRREVFGLAFIEPTVSRYIRCAQAGELDVAEQKWAGDVLGQYFDAVKPGVNALVDTLREQFVAFQTLLAQVETRDEVTLQPKEGEFSPYERIANQPSDVSYEQLVTLCRQRRSVRWFLDKPVPAQDIERAIAVASLAPSACNRQPFQFYSINQAQLAQDIGAIPMGTAGFSNNFQSLIVVVGDLSCYPYERDRHVIYIDGSLASMQLMLALETLGLSSCVINWPDIEQYELRMANRLKLDKHQRPIMVIAVGYADPQGKIPFSQKKTTQQLIKEVTA
jgi:nitroreductase